jgi:sugar lactone lactonase YvrE
MKNFIISLLFYSYATFLVAQQWQTATVPVNNMGASAIALYADGQEDIITIAANGTMIFLSKYTPDGKLLWNTALDSIATYHYPRCQAATVDNNGNIYLAVTNQNKYIVACFNASGALISHFAIAKESTIMAIAIDKHSNIIIAGMCLSPNLDGNDIFVRKYTTKGDSIFDYQIDGATLPEAYKKGYSDYFNKMVIDSQDNIYIIGSMGSCLLVKLDSQGNLLWLRYKTAKELEFFMPQQLLLQKDGSIISIGTKYFYTTPFAFLYSYTENGDSLQAYCSQNTETFFGVIQQTKEGYMHWMTLNNAGSINSPSNDRDDCLLCCHINAKGDTVWANNKICKNGLQIIDMKVLSDNSVVGLVREADSILYLLGYDNYGNNVQKVMIGRVAYTVPTTNIHLIVDSADRIFVFTDSITNGISAPTLYRF